jgi:hypothetical protein
MKGLSAADQRKVRDQWRKLTGRDPDDVAVNIDAVFNEAIETDPMSVAVGRRWYNRARQQAELQSRGLVDNDRSYAIMAALSPQSSWDMNVTGHAAVMAAVKNHPDERDPVALWKYAKDPPPPRAPQTDVSGHKAARIALGESIDDNLRGAKVRSFYNNIRDPDGLEGISDVTVDSHMMDVAYGGTTPGVAGVRLMPARKQVEHYMDTHDLGALPKDWKVQQPAGVDYQVLDVNPSDFTSTPKSGGRDLGVLPLVGDAIRSTTERYNANRDPADQLTPNQVQAIIWTHWLNTHPDNDATQATKTIVATTAEHYGRVNAGTVAAAVDLDLLFAELAERAYRRDERGRY